MRGGRLAGLELDAADDRTATIVRLDLDDAERMASPTGWCYMLHTVALDGRWMVFRVWFSQRVAFLGYQTSVLA